MKTMMVAMAAAAVLLSGCGGGEEKPAAASSSDGLSDKDVAALNGLMERTFTYKVVTTVGGGSVTYKSSTGTSQEDIAESSEASPWVNLIVDTDFAYVSVQNDDEYGDVTCRIMRGDEVVSENTSSAAYGIATCQFPN